MDAGLGHVEMESDRATWDRCFERGPVDLHDALDVVLFGNAEDAFAPAASPCLTP